MFMSEDIKEKRREERLKRKANNKKMVAFVERLKDPNFSKKLYSFPRPTDPRDYSPVTLAPDLESATVLAGDIPYANTPVPRYTKFPEPMLAGCNEPLPEGVVDLRGVWEVYEGPLKGHVERIEQCGDRVVITGGYMIHDMRADGTLEHGVDDTSEVTGGEHHVAALFEDGRLNLRLNGKTLVVSRRLEGNEMIWVYGPFTNRLRRLEEHPGS
jgi:hypothetical protein